MTKPILVTGGAGFVGSNLALSLKRDNPETPVIAFDNLYRKGSELNLPRLAKGAVDFVNGDVRNIEDLEKIGPVESLIECSAEPSVHSGYGESPRYLIDTNLTGLINCLEHIRAHGGDMVFLSTSRVYPIKALSELPLARGDRRLDIAEDAEGLGWSHEGISEAFPLSGIRSLYGTTKLAAELLIQEYCATYDLRAVIDRCGVLAGPWQMGKVDQGFLALWVASHFYGKNLNYHGFGGLGLQVRDVLHPGDLYNLLRIQMADFDKYSGNPYNVGGGCEVSTSLLELTSICEEITGNKIEIGAVSETRDADIAYYIGDSSAIKNTSGWTPQISVREIVSDVYQWIRENDLVLRPIFNV
jgi:CDP-paratose 2-epimerase